MKIKRLILSLIISVLYLVVSFVFFNNLSYQNMENPFVSFLLFPVIIAGAFRFGSGEVLFYFILFFETVFISLLIYLIFGFIRKNANRNSPDL